MNIIYLTTSMLSEDFDKLVANSISKPNPSNQNFHRKLIRLLSLDHQVSVISARPVSPFISHKKRFAAESNQNYYYAGFCNFKLFRPLTLWLSIGQIFKKMIANSGNQTLLMVDGLSLTLAKRAVALAKKHHLPIIGIYTDNPQNLTGVSEQYLHKIEKLYRRFDGFFAITPALNLNINKLAKPAFIFEGLIDEAEKPSLDLKQKYGDYFFFGGALYDRYGVRELIDGFRQTSIKNKLLIAGHGPEEAYVKVAQAVDERIIYLDLLSEAQFNQFTSSALANINPRPLDTALDRQSLPSKTLQYLNSGTITISTKHPRLYHLFNNDVVWLPNSSPSEIAKTLTAVSQDPFSYQVAAKNAQINAKKYFGPESLRQRVNDFFKKNINF